MQAKSVTDNSNLLSNEIVFHRANEQAGLYSNKNGLGLRMPVYDKVLDILKNVIYRMTWVTDIRNAVNLCFWLVFDIRNKGGFLRTLMLQQQVREKWWWWWPDHWRARPSWIFENITSLQYVHSNKPNDTFQGLEIKTYSGRDHILEEMEGLKLGSAPSHSTKPIHCRPMNSI